MSLNVIIGLRYNKTYFNCNFVDVSMNQEVISETVNQLINLL